MAESDATLDSAAAKPLSVTVDGQSVTGHSLGDRIALKKLGEAKTEVENTLAYGFNRINFNPPGARGSVCNE